MKRPLFISAPHAGEKIPDQTPWLKQLPEPILMCDVDRYVDQLYRPAAELLKIPFIVTEWHRSVVDLNRLPEDIDQDAVVGAKEPSGKFTTGFHWVKTTKGDVLMPKPISMQLHQELTENYFKPFHHQIDLQLKKYREHGVQNIYHLDVHSMPSKGTAAHRDPGEVRAEIVVSDVDGKSAAENYKDLVLNAYEKAGFKVAYNWPYKGGRITQTYGQPSKGQHTIQVEMNRSIYMDEVSKKQIPEKLRNVQKQLLGALTLISDGVSRL